MFKYLVIRMHTLKLVIKLQDMSIRYLKYLDKHNSNEYNAKRLIFFGEILFLYNFYSLIAISTTAHFTKFLFAKP